MTENDLEGKEQDVGVEIAFGTTFMRTGKSNQEHIVLDPANTQYFYATKLEEENGHRIINPIGTGTMHFEDIGEITGELTLEEVIAASERGSQGFGLPGLLDSTKQEFEESAGKGSITIIPK